MRLEGELVRQVAVDGHEVKRLECYLALVHHTILKFDDWLIDNNGLNGGDRFRLIIKEFRIPTTDNFLLLFFNDRLLNNEMLLNEFKVNLWAVSDHLDAAAFEFLPLDSLLLEEFLGFCDLGDEVVPDALVHLTAGVVFLALDGGIPALLYDLLRYEHRGLHVPLEGGEHRLPLLLYLGLHRSLVLLAALGPLLTGGEEMASL